MLRFGTRFVIDPAFRWWVDTRAFAAVERLAGERPILWFSTNPYWERSVMKAVKAPDARLQDLSMAEMLKMGIYLFRIGVHRQFAPHTWKALKELSGIDPKTARSLKKAAKSVAAVPYEWCGPKRPAAEPAS